MKNPFQALWERRDETKQRIVLKENFDMTFKDGPVLKACSSVVLAHIRAFCCADATTLKYDDQGRLDAQATLVAEGRREVWNVINFYLNVPEVDLVEADRYATRQLQAVQNRELDS